MSLVEMRQLCVIGFPLSSTRPMIMKGLEKVIEKLGVCNIEGEVWVNGSFITVKIDPEDADMVLCCSAEFYENGTPQQRNTIDWLASDLKSSYFCDSYFFMEWQEGHPMYLFGQYMHNYWMKQFGFSRGNKMKGIAVIDLPGSTS